MAKYRKKPVVIEAWQLGSSEPMPQWLHDAITGIVTPITVDDENVMQSAFITTLEGTMTGNSGDWIIRGVKGELYPCKPDIFAASYEPHDDAPGEDKPAEAA